MSQQAIDQCIREALDAYLKDLGDIEPKNVHALFLAAMERPLLEAVMQRVDGNQSRAAQWLGIHRNTLRRKLVELGIEPR
jgi:Fis family transcriptional regulator